MNMESCWKITDRG